MNQPPEPSGDGRLHEAARRPASGPRRCRSTRRARRTRRSRGRRSGSRRRRTRSCRTPPRRSTCARAARLGASVDESGPLTTQVCDGSRGDAASAAPPPSSSTEHVAAAAPAPRRFSLTRPPVAALLYPVVPACVPGSASRRLSSNVMRIFSGIQPTGAKHFGNYSGGFRQYAATQESGARGGRRGVLLHRRPALDHGRLRPGRPARALARPGRAALRDRARPGALDGLRAEPRDRARRGGVAAVGGDELRPARPHDAVQGEGRPAGVPHRGPLHVPDPDGRRHPALPDDARPDRRRPAPAPRARRATSRSASTRRFGQTFAMPGRDLPGGRRARDGPAGADEEDVDDGRHAAGHDPDARPARGDPQEGARAR